MYIVYVVAIASIARTKICILIYTRNSIIYQPCTNNRHVFCNNCLLVSRSLVSFVFIDNYYLGCMDAIPIRTTLVMPRSSSTGSGHRLTSISLLSFLHDFYHCINIAAIYQFSSSFGNNQSWVGRYVMASASSPINRPATAKQRKKAYCGDNYDSEQFWRCWCWRGGWPGCRNTGRHRIYPTVEENFQLSTRKNWHDETES